MTDKHIVQRVLKNNVETFKLKVAKARDEAGPYGIKLWERSLGAAEKRLAKHIEEHGEL